MRESNVRGVLIYCADFKCSHSTAVSVDQWPDDVRLSNIEDRVVCKACGKRGADLRPDVHWEKNPPVNRLRGPLVQRELLRAWAYSARLYTSSAFPPDEVRATPKVKSSPANLIIDHF